MDRKAAWKIILKNWYTTKSSSIDIRLQKEQNAKLDKHQQSFKVFLNRKQCKIMLMRVTE